MARMLEILDIKHGQRVLEIGTGTGYQAGLLCHRLGEGNVFSVDIDANLVTLARQQLASIGYRPTLAALDGELGFAEHQPYDHIIATCSVPAVPRSWGEQLAPGGSILVDLVDRPDWGRLGLTVHGNGRNQVWIDKPDGEPRSVAGSYGSAGVIGRASRHS